MLPKLSAEFIGTALFLFSITLLVHSGSVLTPLAIGVVLMVLVYAFANSSGSHLNPAVTVAILIRGKIPAIEVLPYILAQLAGGLLGAALGASVSAPVAIAPTVGLLAAVTIEAVFTFMLALVVLLVATHPKAAGNGYFGAAIGLAIAVAATAGGHLSGGAFNPAVGLALATVGGTLPDVAALYSAGPLVGGVAAGLVYKLVE